MSKQLSQPGKSVWGPDSHHKRKYKRRSVKRDIKKLGGFIGWTKLKFILKAVRRYDQHTARQTRNVAFVCTLFETGGRISEVLALLKTHFRLRYDTEPPIAIVSGMPLEKRYEKEGDYIECLLCHEHNDKWTRECEGCGASLIHNGKLRYITRKLDVKRNDFSIRLDEPLADPMVEWIKDCDGGLLFLSPYRDGPLSRQWAYNLVREAGKLVDMHLYDHWFRGQRASQLADEYQLKEMDLLEWFEWEKVETAKQYTKLGPLGQARKMGVKVDVIERRV